MRDWLDASGWDHEPPPPELPAEVVAAHGGQVPGGVRAHHAASRGPRYLARVGVAGPTTAEGVRMTFTFEVLVSLKPGLADPRARR